MVKAKCSEVYDQSFARFSRIGIINSCSGFRLGWEMALLPPEERVIADPDEYDSLNELEVGNYIQRHYIEKEGLRIDFLSEDEEEDHEVEDVEMDDSQLELCKDPPQVADAPASSSGTFDDLVSLNFSQPAASPGITLEGLAGLQTPESGINPLDQSSSSVATATVGVSGVPTAAGPSASQGGAVI